VESLKLASFYRNLAAWPCSESELASAAERVRKLLEAPLVAIWVPELGVKIAGLDAAGDPELEGFAALIRTHIQEQPKTSSTNGQSGIQKIPLARSAAIARDDLRVSDLETVPISAELNLGAGAHQHPGPTRFGRILLASDSPLGPRDEAILLAAAQHLADLAVVNQFEQAISQRDQFLSIASHELKTPLTSIYGILQLQERMLRPRKDVPQTPEQERQHSFFKIVIRQVERLNELIDGLLNVSRITNGRFAVEPSEADVASIVNDTVNSRLKVIAQEAGVRLDVNTPKSLTAMVDPIRFEEVVTNLGMNAIRFSPEGGTVWIQLSPKGESFVLSFRDQGPALPDADRARIFQPFERAQRTSRLGGLGLGLFISRQIAQLHGGDVILSESLPGRGNVFEARFPLRAAQQISA
jgi:signal transduction histidine kinase